MPADVAGFLGMCQAPMSTSARAKSPGGTQWRGWAQRIAELKTEASRQGVDLAGRVASPSGPTCCRV
jgi:hypothetical protein